MAHCFTPIRGRRMRVTKVNALGRPVYGANSFVTTSGFVSVQFTPEIAEGEETEVRTASGEICVSERGCDELRWITVQIEFCQVDPCLFTLINETWTELRDCVGEVIGWAESHKFSCDSGFAMELWTDVTGYTPTTPGAQGAWGYLLLPFIVGGTLGEQTVENGAISFTITGRTKKGSGWGVGPFDVMCNDAVTGACGPLLTPVGPDEPRRIMLTTCPPPAAACGCQPLSSPDGPPVTVAEVPPEAGQPRRRVSVLIPNGTVGSYRVSWGDGSPVEDPVVGTPLVHTYDRDGEFVISVWDTSNTQRVTTRTVRVPFVGAVTPTFTVAQEGANDRMARVTVTNPQPGRTYEVKWEDSQAEWQDLPSTGTPPHSAVHTYTVDGSKTVQVRDNADPTKLAQKTVTIPFAPIVQPILLATEQRGTPPTNRRNTRVTVTNPQAGVAYEISWNGGSTYSALPSTGTPAYSATFNETGSVSSLTVVVRQTDVPTNSAQVVVPLPHPGPTFAMIEGATNMEVSLTVDNPGAATFEAEWVSGTWTPLTTGAGTHTYAVAGTYPVRVRDAAAPTVIARQQVTVPFAGALGSAAVPQEDGGPETVTASDAEQAPAAETTTRKRSR